MSAVLFSLDIKTSKGVVKLPVLSGDSFRQIINRLVQISSVPEEKRVSVGPKLRQELEQLLEKGKISEKVRSKVAGLLGKKEDGEEEANRSSEAHFRVLQESIQHAKLNNLWNQKKHYKYLQEGLDLNVKYLSGDIDELLPQYHHNKSPSKSPKCITTSVPNDNPTALIKKYEALDRKCQEFIIKNIKNNGGNMKNEPVSDSKRNEQYLQYMRPSLPSQRRTTPNEMDRKFMQLNIEPLKAIGERTDNTDYPKTERISPARRSPLPFQPVERKIGKRYNYLNNVQ